MRLCSPLTLALSLLAVWLCVCSVNAEAGRKSPVEASKVIDSPLSSPGIPPAVKRLASLRSAIEETRKKDLQPGWMAHEVNKLVEGADLPTRSKMPEAGRSVDGDPVYVPVTLVKKLQEARAVYKGILPETKEGHVAPVIRTTKPLYDRSRAPGAVQPAAKKQATENKSKPGEFKSKSGEVFKLDEHGLPIVPPPVEQLAKAVVAEAKSGEKPVAVKTKKRVAAAHATKKVEQGKSLLEAMAEIEADMESQADAEAQMETEGQATDGVEAGAEAEAEAETEAEAEVESEGEAEEGGESESEGDAESEVVDDNQSWDGLTSDSDPKAIFSQRVHPKSAAPEPDHGVLALEHPDAKQFIDLEALANYGQWNTEGNLRKRGGINEGFHNPKVAARVWSFHPQQEMEEAAEQEAEMEQDED